jgi:ferredoxin-type protein NapG
VRETKRRAFLLGTLAAASMGSLPLSTACSAPLHELSHLRFLRPPGAKSEAEFLDTCIRCGQCGQVCPNQAISYFKLENGYKSVDTPFIIPREQACILCMKCGDVCPSGAIAKIPAEAEPILAQVQMGKAVVDKHLCLSYNGKTCGVCYRACPLPDISMKCGMLEQPIVTDACIGCGLCERACIQMPQAIRIVPAAALTKAV